METAASPDPDTSEDETDVAPPPVAASRGDEPDDGRADTPDPGALIAPDGPTAKPSGLIEFDDFSDDEDDTPSSPSAPAAALENVACALWEWLAPQCGIEAFPLGGGASKRVPADRQLADVATFADALRRANGAVHVLALLARLGPRGEAVGVEQLFATDVGRVVGRLARALAGWRVEGRRARGRAADRARARRAARRGRARRGAAPARAARQARRRAAAVRGSLLDARPHREQTARPRGPEGRRARDGARRGVARSARGGAPAGTAVTPPDQGGGFLMHRH